MNFKPPINRTFFDALLLGCAVLTVLLLRVTLAHADTPADAASRQISLGRAIYLDGAYPDGRPVRAIGAASAMSGKETACVHCHRGSGLGQVEGEYAVPPVTGRALFGPARSVITTADRVRGKQLNQSHEPYSDTDFAAMMREGKHPASRSLDPVMPRYELDDEAMAALQQYLHTLSASADPGVDTRSIRIATIIAPDVEPQRKKAFLDTLRMAVRQKNANTMPGKRHMVSAAEFGMKTERRWQLSVWQLEGPESTWLDQLEDHYRREPVFLVLSGITDSSWAPMHRFCETQRVPCWFPSTPSTPAEAATGQYSLYFQRGVLLEADLIAEQMLAMQGSAKTRARRRVLQITDGTQPANDGAAMLAQRLDGTGISRTVLTLTDTNQRATTQALRALRADDDVVLWLHAPALSGITRQAPATKARIYLSGRLSGGEKAELPKSWQRANMAYLYELPEQRTVSTAYFRHWLEQTRIPLTDEPLQSEVYFAVSYLSDTISEMLTNLHRDYLIERAELMLSRREARKAEEEARDGQTLRRYATAHPLSKLGPSAIAFSTREGTTVYPALALGPGQRFASKGGYVIPVAALQAGDNHAAWTTP